MDQKRLELVKSGRIDHLERRWRFRFVGLTQETYRRRALTVLNTPEGEFSILFIVNGTQRRLHRDPRMNTANVRETVTENV